MLSEFISGGHEFWRNDPLCAGIGCSRKSGLDKSSSCSKAPGLGPSARKQSASEGALILIDLLAAQGGDDFAPAVVTRIFLINACAFGALLALKTLVADVTPRCEGAATLTPRHI